MADWQYWYCILEGNELPSGSYRGLDDEPISAVGYRGMCAVVSAAPGSQVPVTGERVMAHERLVEELMGARSLLPVRFGTLLPGTDQVRLALSQRYGDYLRDLDRLRDKVEMGVRVMGMQRPSGVSQNRIEPSRATGPGARYMAERLKQHTRVRESGAAFMEVTSAINSCLARQSEARRAIWSPSERMVMSAAFLIWRHRLQLFKEETESLQASYPQLQFLLTGPWPPYNFVSRVQDESILPEKLG